MCFVTFENIIHSVISSIIPALFIYVVSYENVRSSFPKIWNKQSQLLAHPIDATSPVIEVCTPAHSSLEMRAAIQCFVTLPATS
uniref:Uncharacterized protein n=1 Tax=Anguilla anguilla TaxID=7936 RepID=A0A0E9X3G5_ANGAN